jgi:FlaA1/EpsC-like NDP-sugar epimerase
VTSIAAPAAEVSIDGTLFRLLHWGWMLPRRVKQIVMVLSDVSLLIVAFILATLVFYDWLPPFPSALWEILGVTVTGGILGFYVAGLYRTFFRYWGGGVFGRTFLGAGLAALAGTLYSHFLYSDALGTGYFLGFAVLAVIATSSSRLLLSILLRRMFDQSAEPVVIYGAGDAGQQVLALMRGGRDYRPVSFVDDDPRLWGQTINGLQVRAPASLPAIRKSNPFDRVILALPSVTGARRRAILAELGKLGAYVVSVPAIEEILEGRKRIDQFKELDVNDLLARDSVDPVLRLFRRCVEGKTVLVSGAGGSIGSEICRQVIAAGVRRLVLLEISEVALYEIDRGLRETIQRDGLVVELVPLLCDAKDAARVAEVLAAFEISTIYHAAAYKHVPIVESNVIAGIRNNVFGTLTIAEAAIRAGIADFVLVSTDKAVKPTNVMGATKRVAELVLQALQGRGSGTRFSMVRFGNVLASSGSVVPLFREQVRCGGPVTVTHPEVTRYFMTIPEAAQLVIQASGLARGGEVFLLDMGQPVRIRDLAVLVIELMGKTVRDSANPGGDIEIRYTDLRPGEKLYEELLIDSEAEPTEHPKIRCAVEPHLGWIDLAPLLEELAVACTEADSDRCRLLLRRLVPEYTPSHVNHDWFSQRTVLQ